MLIEDTAKRCQTWRGSSRVGRGVNILKYFWEIMKKRPQLVSPVSKSTIKLGKNCKDAAI